MRGIAKMSDYSQSLISLLAYHATARPDAIALRHKTRSVAAVVMEKFTRT